MQEIGLEECIKSALKNLTSETEIILIDDFSQDNSIHMMALSP